MTRFTWPWIFRVQAAMGIISLAGVFKMTESHPSPSGGPVSDLLKSYGRVLGNKRFAGVVLCSSMIGLPHFAFIAGSSSIYIRDFHVSPGAFSLFFGANALCLMAGSMLCARFGARIGTLSMMTAGYAGMVIGGIFMFSGMIKGPLGLAIPMGIISFTGGLSRPPSNTIALEQVKKDTGTASSAMVFSYFIFGAISMAMVSLDWADKVRYLAVLAMISGILALTLWTPLRKRLVFPS
jgi:DHA1 family bicyclomycin/chloramphenicol resistance-like MFS transporter